MWTNPVLFPSITNQESWVQTVQICDDATGDLITLVDPNGNTLYSVDLEICRPRPGQVYGYAGYAPYYDNESSQAPLIFQTLAQGAPALGGNQYITITDIGTISIQLPRSMMQSLSGDLTYDVFLNIGDPAHDDGRQVLIGRLPILWGGKTSRTVQAPVTPPLFQPLTLSASAFEILESQGTVIANIGNVAPNYLVFIQSQSAGGAMQVVYTGAGWELQVGPTPPSSPTTITLILGQALLGTAPALTTFQITAYEGVMLSGECDFSDPAQSGLVWLMWGI